MSRLSVACLVGHPFAPAGGIPCCEGCACTCGTDFPYPCECHPFRVAEADRAEANEAFEAL